MPAKSQHLYRNELLAQVSVQQVDDHFFKQIQLVADGFKKFEKDQGQFPLYNMFGGQMVYVVDKALVGQKTNPYYERRNDIAASAALAAGTLKEVDFRFMSDDKLSEDQLNTYKENPPEEWSGNPGTIVAYGDKDAALMLFFGIGANGKPLREQNADGSPGTLRFVLLHHQKKI